MTEKKLKTRCYYTEYVNHMVRFYLTCPDALRMEGKRRADVDNWVAVQTVLHMLTPQDRVRVIDIYKTHFNLPKAVDQYCAETGADKTAMWILLTKVASRIARVRGLV